MKRIFLLPFANSLMDLGEWLLKNKLFQTAIFVGNMLSLIRYSGGFEIKAQAHQMMGNTIKAIAILEYGLQKPPQAWVLHTHHTSPSDGVANTFPQCLQCTASRSCRNKPQASHIKRILAGRSIV